MPGPTEGYRGLAPISLFLFQFDSINVRPLSYVLKQSWHWNYLGSFCGANLRERKREREFTEALVPQFDYMFWGKHFKHNKLGNSTACLSCVLGQMVVHKFVFIFLFLFFYSD